MANLAHSATPPRTPWHALRVQAGNPALPTTFTGPVRLMALYRWRRHDGPPGVWFVASPSASESLRPEDVDWSLFPTPEAQRHLIDHEERCARHVRRPSYF